MSNTVLEVSDLSVAIKGGDRTHAVQGINLTVGADEIVCVVGESGSGKSVTAQAVMGLLPKGAMQVESGSIRLQGDQLLTKSDAELRAIRGTRMAMVFQEPMTALNPVERVGDQIREVLEIHTSLDQKEQRARVLEIMRAVHLPDPEQMIDAYPHQLSGGQRQRIMIAAALVLDPALLIADEPTTALDVTTQAQILKLVREMQGRTKTGVLFITHDFGVVSEIADRVVVMQMGRIVEQGPCEEVLRNPREDYTRMLLAAVPSMTPPKRSPVTGPVVLQTENLFKTYGKRSLFQPKARVVAAVKDVSLTIRRGETLGIVGESGSGKSTVARCVARLVDTSARRHQDRRHRYRGDAGSKIPPDAPARSVHLPGPVSIAQSAPHGRRGDHRGTDEFWPQPQGGIAARARPDGRGASAAGCDRSFPASVLRRPAPADLHRAGAGDGA